MKVIIHFTVINDDEDNFYEYDDCIEVDEIEVDETIERLEKYHHNVYC